MKKIILIMGMMLLLLMSMAMAAEDNNRFENVKAWFINDDANGTQDQNRTMDQERMQMEQDARRTAEQDATGYMMAQMNKSDIPEKAGLLLEQMQVGERVQVKEQHKLFGLFNIERNVEYEKTITGAKRVKKMFDFMYRYGAE